VRFQKPAGVVERQHAAARGLHVEVGQLLHDLAEVLLGAGMVVIPRAGEAPESAAAIGFPAKPGEPNRPSCGTVGGYDGSWYAGCAAAAVTTTSVTVNERGTRLR